MPVLLKNKFAFHRYKITKRFTAGISLTGAEVKAIRNHNVEMKNAFVIVRNNEALVINMNLTAHEAPVVAQPLRSRRLLLHTREISRLQAYLLEKGTTGVVLNLLLSPQGWIKTEIGIGKTKNVRGKKRFREDQEAERSLKKVKKYYQ